MAKLVEWQESCAGVHKDFPEWQARCLETPSSMMHCLYAASASCYLLLAQVKPRHGLPQHVLADPQAARKLANIMRILWRLDVRSIHMLRKAKQRSFEDVVD